MISQTFRATVKLHKMRQYEIARLAGLHHTTLSKILCGIDPVKEGDPRVLRVAAVIGLRPKECFEESEMERSAV